MSRGFVRKCVNAVPQPFNPRYSTGQVALVPSPPLVLSRRFRLILSLILILAASPPEEPTLSDSGGQGVPPATQPEKADGYPGSAAVEKRGAAASLRGAVSQ